MLIRFYSFCSRALLCRILAYYLGSEPYSTLGFKVTTYRPIENIVYSWHGLSLPILISLCSKDTSQRDTSVTNTSDHLTTEPKDSIFEVKFLISYQIWLFSNNVGSAEDARAEISGLEIFQRWSKHRRRRPVYEGLNLRQIPRQCCQIRQNLNILVIFCWWAKTLSMEKH